MNNSYLEQMKSDKEKLRYLENEANKIRINSINKIIGRNARKIYAFFTKETLLDIDWAKDPLSFKSRSVYYGPYRYTVGQKIYDTPIKVSCYNEYLKSFSGDRSFITYNANPLWKDSNGDVHLLPGVIENLNSNDNFDSYIYFCTDNMRLHINTQRYCVLGESPVGEEQSLVIPMYEQDLNDLINYLKK